MNTVKAFLGMALLWHAAPAQNVVRYPYDLTDATRAKPASTEYGIELRVARRDLFAGYLCGAYAGSSYVLHVFPDGSALLETTCDICPTTLLAEGKWSEEETGIHIHWAARHFAATEEERFHREFGACEKMTLLLGFKGGSGGMEAGVWLVSSELCEKFIDAFQATRNQPAQLVQTPRLSKRPESLKAYASADFLRMEKYVDWQKIRGRLEASKAARQ